MVRNKEERRWLVSWTIQKAPEAPSGEVRQLLHESSQRSSRQLLPWFTGLQWITTEHDHQPLASFSPSLSPLPVCVCVCVVCLCVCVCQIAPPETPDVIVRMVIITGTPEAQFKVKHRNVSSSKYDISSVRNCGWSCSWKLMNVCRAQFHSKQQWITVCPHFPQSLLASYPPLYSRPRVGYLGSWRRRTSSQRRRRSNWRLTSRFPLLQPAGSSVKEARRWVRAGFGLIDWFIVKVVVFNWGYIHIYIWIYITKHVFGHDSIMSFCSLFYFPLLKVCFGSYSLLLLRVKGRGCHTLFKPYETNCDLWIWAIQIQFDWFLSLNIFTQEQGILWPYFL